MIIQVNVRSVGKNHHFKVRKDFQRLISQEQQIIIVILNACLYFNKLFKGQKRSKSKYDFYKNRFLSDSNNEIYLQKT